MHCNAMCEYFSQVHAACTIVHGGRATSFDEKRPNIGIHHPPLSIIINELMEPLVFFRYF